MNLISPKFLNLSYLKYKALPFILLTTTLMGCDKSNIEPAPTPQLAEYIGFEDCPIDAMGTLNDYEYNATGTVNFKPQAPFVIAFGSHRNFGASSISLYIFGKYDSLTLGIPFDPIPDSRPDSVNLPTLESGEVMVNSGLVLDAGVRVSMTFIEYELLEASQNNTFVLDSVDFVDNNPVLAGGMWYGHFDLFFRLVNTPENKEGIDFARSIGLQVPETLHYQNVSFSAPTKVSHIFINCGR